MSKVGGLYLTLVRGYRTQLQYYEHSHWLKMHAYMPLQRTGSTMLCYL